MASKSLASRPIAPDPGEEPLYDPTPRIDGEADLVGVVAHDSDRRSTLAVATFSPSIPAVGEDPLDEREDGRFLKPGGSAAFLIPSGLDGLEQKHAGAARVFRYR